MRRTFLILSLVFASQLAVFAGASSDPFVTAVNEAWVKKDDAALATLMEKNLKDRPDDILVLAAAYNYYTLFMPDLPKATELANKIKVIADKNPDNPGLKGFSDGLQKKLPAQTESGLKPVDDKKRESIHKVFPQQYPGMSLGIVLQDAMKK